MLGDAEALALFRRYYEPAKRHQRALIGEWSQYENAYFGEPPSAKPEGEDAWRSYIFFKYGWQQIHTLAAELAGDDDAGFAFEARNHLADKNASITQGICDYQFASDDYPFKRLLAVLWAAVYGGCPLKVVWDYDCVHRPIRMPDGSVSRIKVTVKDQPTILLVDPHDFMYDVRATSTRDWRYVFHRMRIELAELQSRTRADGEPLYKNLDKLESIVNGDDADIVREYDNDFSGERDRAKREGIEIIEMWTQDRLIVIAAGGVVIRDEPNPYFHGRIPFEVATIIPTLNDVWGQSMMWALRDIQELLWTLDNAQMDALKLTLDPPKAVDVSVDPEAAEGSIYPGRSFPTRQGAREAVAPINVVGADLFVNDQAIGATRNQMEYITGITREMAGQSNADTATQAALNQRQSKGRVGVMMRMIDRSFARCAEMFVQLNQQFLDLSKPVRIMGPGGSAWRHVAMEEIAGLYNVRVKNSSERAVLELKKQNDLEALSNLLPANGIVTPSGMTVDLAPLLREIADDHKINPDEVIVPVDGMFQQQLKQAQVEAQQQAIMAQAMPQPEGPDIAQKLFESMNFKDIPPHAQQAMLQQAGLPADDIHNASSNQAPADQPPEPNPISEGLKAHAEATS